MVTIPEIADRLQQDLIESHREKIKKLRKGTQLKFVQKALGDWVEWKSLDGIRKHNEQCAWLEPPDPPRPDPDKLWWNECDQP
jgi:hypothetical protein